MHDPIAAVWPHEAPQPRQPLGVVILPPTVVPALVPPELANAKRNWSVGVVINRNESSIGLTGRNGTTFDIRAGLVITHRLLYLDGEGPGPQRQRRLWGQRGTAAAVRWVGVR